MRQRVAVLLVVASAILAGCTVLPGGGGENGGAPSTSTSPATVEDADAIPGVENRRLVNASALASAHEDALVGQGFVMTYESQSNYTAGYPQQVPNGTRFGRRKAEAGLSAYHRFERERLAPDEGTSPTVVTDEIWVNETTAVHREQHAERTEYKPYHFERYSSALTGADSLVASLLRANFTVVDARRVDNRTLYTFEASYDRTGPRNETYQARLVTDQQGRIWRLTETTRRHVTTPPGWNATSVTRYEYRLRQLGNVTVAEPVWLEEARERGVLANK